MVLLFRLKKHFTLPPIISTSNLNIVYINQQANSYNKLSYAVYIKTT